MIISEIPPSMSIDDGASSDPVASRIGRFFFFLIKIFL